MPRPYRSGLARLPVQARSRAQLCRKPKQRPLAGWASLRAAHLKAFPACAACGSTTHVQVHHIRPVRTHPHLGLEPTNLLSLCRSMATAIDCHLDLGHLGQWDRHNAHVLATVQYMAPILHAIRAAR